MQTISESQQVQVELLWEVCVVLNLSMKLFLPIRWLPPGFLFLLLSLGEAQEQTPTTEWTTAFSLESEHQILRDSLLTVLPHMAKEWKITFEVNPTHFRWNGWKSVLHMTTGGKGDRVPAIWFHKTRGIHISIALDGRASFNRFFDSKLLSLPLAGEWTRIEVSQILVSSRYMYSITIGNEVFSNPNKKPVELSEVKVYASSPWYARQKGSLRNLRIEMKAPIAECIVREGEMHFPLK